MSHHLDSALARKDPRLDITDQYVFGSASSTVLVMNAHTSLVGDVVPAGFHPEGRYEFRVHVDDAAVEELTYRVTFQPAAEDSSQPLEVRRLSGTATGADDADGPVVARGRTGETCEGVGGLRVWAGPALDPFFLDLRLLHAVQSALQRGEKVPLEERTADMAQNSFAGSSTCSIVLDIPHSDLELRPGRRIGVWSTTRLPTDTRAWSAVNRAGLPMIWPLFRADSSEEASTANTTHPAEDFSRYGQEIADQVGSVVLNHGSVPDPAAYAEVAAHQLCPGILPYVVGTPAVFGFAERNGRALGDNAPEVMFSLVTGRAVSTGLTARRASDTRQDDFPYVVPRAG